MPWAENQWADWKFEFFWGGCKASSMEDLANPRAAYYSVEVKATTFLYGGLAIGVTQRRPSEFEKLPDTGRRLEDTCLVGYWANCAFVNKVHHKTHWDPATLCVGSKVGVLVTKEGDLKIFVDHMEVDCLKGVINVTPKLELYPVMDLYSTCKSLKLFFWMISMRMADKI